MAVEIIWNMYLSSTAFNPYTATRRFGLIPFTASEYYNHHAPYTPFTATDDFTCHVCDFSF